MLDLVLTNNLYFVDSVDYQHPLGCSDHISIVIYLNFEDNEHLNCTGKRLYYRGDYPSMNLFFEDTDWVNVLSDMNTQQSWDLFAEKFQEAIDTFIPINDKPGNVHENKLWWNSTVKVNVHNKKQSWSKLWNVIKSNRTHAIQADVKIEKAEWKNSRKVATVSANKARSDYESKIILSCKYNPKSFWSYVKSRTKKPGDVSSLEDNDGQLFHNDFKKCNMLNEYFASVFVNEVDDNFFQANRSANVNNSIESVVVNQDIIMRAIDKLQVSKAPGPDGIHARIIKECKLIFSLIFNIIFNKSIEEGILPMQWKQANVKALFKKGKRTLCSNYRPVSLTSIICKILEGVIRDSIMLFLEQFNLITCHQHGFRSGHSCTTQLLEMMEDFTDYYDERIPFDCVYLDFAKAFDRVPHQRLLTKLYNIGVRGKIFGWITDFLSSRKQRVVVNNSVSQWTSVVSGIPQGSVLGPILFTIFINDLPVDINSHVKIFADDTKIYNAANLSGVIQADLVKLTEWSSKWLLPFNTDKCKVLHYGKTNVNVPYTMNNNILSTGASIKDLGVTFVDNLSFDDHISKITSTANSRLGIIRNTFHQIDCEGFLILYKSNVRPLLEFGMPVWSPFLRKHDKQIEQIQRRATKLIKGCEDLSYSGRLRKLKLPTLLYRRRRCDMLQVFRIVKNIDHISSDSMFNFNIGITRKNHIYKMDKPRANCSIKKHSFSHRVINDWNVNGTYLKLWVRWIALILSKLCWSHIG